VTLVDDSPAAKRVRSYYESKTASIIAKYGRGSLVHFHIGLAARGAGRDLSLKELHASLHAAQQALLEDSLKRWRFPEGGELLDVGSGLGGGAIHCAATLRTRVTAVTDVAAHAEWTRKFANDAGVGELVQPLVCDATRVPGNDCYDGGMALESSCYLDRPTWFLCLAKLMRRGATVGLIDAMAPAGDAKQEFDEYWRTVLGGVDVYLAAAEGAGLTLEGNEDLARETAGFWDLSIAYAKRCLDVPDVSSTEVARLEASIEHHAWLRERFLGGAIDYRRLTFRKR
jgi:tocopherol O-methyltransferase